MNIDKLERYTKACKVVNVLIPIERDAVLKLIAVVRAAKEIANNMKHSNPHKKLREAIAALEGE